MKLEITTEKVKEAAEKHPEAKDTLKTLFPDAFKPQPVALGDEDCYYSADGKLLFTSAYMSAPPGMEHKCAVIGDDYRAELTVYGGNQILTFYRK